MKPIIGVMPLWDEEKDSIWMLPGYMDGIRQAGGIPIILPFTTDAQEIGRLVGLCAGIVFTGGQDVLPAVYGEAPLEGMIDGCAKRDETEILFLRQALSADIAVLGICRGIQLINAALGGSLYQDLPTQRPSKTAHRQKPPYDSPAHDVTIVRDSPLYACLGREILPVNSCHHQAVRTLAPGLSVMAQAPDGLIEAVCKPDARFLWAVQWHPEFSYRKDENSRRIFRAFADAAREIALLI